MEKGVRSGEAISAVSKYEPPTALGRVEMIPSWERNSDLSPLSEVTLSWSSFLSYFHPLEKACGPNGAFPQENYFSILLRQCVVES